MPYQVHVSALHTGQTALMGIAADGFVEMGSAQFSFFSRLHDDDPDVQDVVLLLETALFGGNILFHRKGKKLNESAARWYSNTWKGFLIDFQRSQDKWGFAAVDLVDHPDFVTAPLVLDLSQVAVHMKTDRYGRVEMRYQDRGSVAPGAILDPARIVASYSDVTDEGKADTKEVLTFVSRAPTSGGVLRPILTPIIALREHETFLMRCSRMAEQLRCRPPIVTQQLSLNATTSKQNAPAPPPAAGAEQARIGKAAEQKAIMNGAVQVDPNMGDDLELDALNSGNWGSPERVRDYIWNRKYGTAGSRVRGVSNPQIYLQTDRELVKQIQAEPPADLLAFSERKRLQVLRLFGTPADMLTGTRTKEKGAVVTENSVYLFHLALKGRRTDLLDVCFLVFDVCYRFHFMVERALDMALQQVDPTRASRAMMGGDAFASSGSKRKRASDDEKETSDDADEKQTRDRTKRNIKQKHEVMPTDDDLDSDPSAVDIVLPGIPSQEIMDAFWEKGILSYEAYINYCASTYALPLAYFNKEPLVKIGEAEGLKVREQKLAEKTQKDEAEIARDQLEVDSELAAAKAIQLKRAPTAGSSSSR